MFIQEKPSIIKCPNCKEFMTLVEMKEKEKSRVKKKLVCKKCREEIK